MRCSRDVFHLAIGSLTLAHGHWPHSRVRAGLQAHKELF